MDSIDRKAEAEAADSAREDSEDWDDPVLQKLALAPGVSPPRRFDGSDRFEIERSLGEGATGAVYQALDRKSGAVVALKALRAADPDAIYRFKREFRSLSDIVHPNLVRLDELVLHENRWFIVMELVRGVPFDEHVRQSPAELRAATLQLARGLNRIHAAGKLHRDVKPSNVLVEPGGRVVLLDFGLAVESTTGVDTAVAGTPRYMAPEYWTRGELGEASDWYALGVMVYEALAHRPPYEGSAREMQLEKSSRAPEPPSRSRSDVPPDLESLCLALLDADASKRPRGPEIVAWLAGGEEDTRPEPGDGFVGRAEEIAALAAALDGVRQGGPAMLLVVGEPGVGKTALLDRAAQVLARRHPGLLWLGGRCRERESMPYKALDGAIDQIVRWLLALPADERLGLLPRDVTDLARQFPAFEKLRMNGTRSGGSGNERAALESLRELVGRIADRRPLVMALDDLQWGDADSALVLTELLRPPNAPPVLYVGSCREGEQDTSPLLAALRGRAGSDAPALREIRIGPLGDEDARLLAHELSRVSDVSDASSAADRLAKESGGNPLFLRELVLLGHGRSGTAFPAPTLASAILERVAQLPEDARRLLDATAVADNPEKPTVLGRVLGLEGDLRAPIAALRAGQLIRVREGDGGETIECYHDRIRETLRAALPEDRARSLHLALADALRNERNERNEEAAPAERIARHYASAGCTADAVRYATAAGRRAAASFAHEHAADLFRLAIELSEASGPPRWELRRDLGDALAASGRGGEAADAFLGAARSAPPDESIDLRRRAATTLLATGYMDRGLDVLQGVMGQLGLRFTRSTPLAAAALALGRARIRLRGLDFQVRAEQDVPREQLRKIDALRSASLALQLTFPVHSVELASRHFLLAMDSGVLDRVIPALCLEAMASAFSSGAEGRSRTHEILGRARELAAGTGEAGAQAWYLIARANAVLLEGRFGELQEIAREALTLRERAEAASRAWPDLNFDGAQMFHHLALWWRGLPGPMGREVPGFARDLKRRGNRLGFMWMSFYEAWVLIARGRPEEGRALVGRTMREWSVHTFHMQAWWEVLANVYVDLYERRGREAWGRMQHIWPKLERAFLLSNQLHRIEARWIFARAGLAFAVESPADRGALLRSVEKQCDRIERDDAPWGNALAMSLRASVASIRGERGAAELLLADAIPLLGAHCLDGVAASALRARGHLIGGQEGQALLLRSNTWMESQDIAEPEAFAALYLPGAWGG